MEPKTGFVLFALVALTLISAAMDGVECKLPACLDHPKGSGGCSSCCNRFELGAVASDSETRCMCGIDDDHPFTDICETVTDCQYHVCQICCSTKFSSRPTEAKARLPNCECQGIDYKRLPEDSLPSDPRW